MGKKSKRSRGQRPTAAVTQTRQQLVDISTQNRVHPLFISTLTKQLLSPQRSHGLEDRLKNEEALSSYLKLLINSVSDEHFSFFVGPLLQGLQDEDGDSINTQIPINPQGDRISLLAMVCQWKSMKKQIGWSGQSEAVRMVLAHPKIRINDTMPNGCNAGFFCVKYADAETLRYIIEAGCNLTQKDKNGSSVLKNAVEYANPKILELVLAHVSPMETFPKYDSDCPSRMRVIGYSTAVDSLLSNYLKDYEQSDSGLRIPGPTSWIVLGGPPPVEDVVECLIMLRKEGVKFTWELDKSTNFYFLSVCFGNTRVESSIRKLGDFKKIGLSIFGMWLPPSIKKEIASVHELDESIKENEHKPSECVICSGPYHKPTRLYCGHSFCRECIVEIGKHHSKCPICYRKLCLDVAPHRDQNVLMSSHDGRFSNNGNIDNNWMIREISLFKQLENLSNEQVLHEAKELGICSMISRSSTIREKLQTEIFEGHQQALHAKSSEMEITSSFRNDGPKEGDKVTVGAPLLELSASATMASPGAVLISPRYGPAYIEIMLHGVPILAGISNNSRYTVLSRKFANTMGLKEIPNLTTSKLKCGLNGKKIGRATCLEEFELFVGDVPVVLENAMVCDGLASFVGIQLGQDFFLSAKYCCISVAVSTEKADNSNMMADGTCSWFTTNSPSDSLRYYSFDNKIVKVPIIHFNPTAEGSFSAVALKPDATFLECSYCCRVFPAWKNSRCAGCESAEVSYCNERCQTLSRKVHLKRKPNCGKRG